MIVKGLQDQNELHFEGHSKAMNGLEWGTDNN